MSEEQKKAISERLKQLKKPRGECAKYRMYDAIKERYREQLHPSDWDWLSKEIAKHLGI